MFVTPISVITVINPYKNIFIIKTIDFSSFACSDILKYPLVILIDFNSSTNPSGLLDCIDIYLNLKFMSL